MDDLLEGPAGQQDAEGVETGKKDRQHGIDQAGPENYVDRQQAVFNDRVDGQPQVERHGVMADDRPIKVKDREKSGHPAQKTDNRSEQNVPRLVPFFT